MYKQIIKQPNIRGIAAGAIATGEIPTVGTHYGTYLRCLSAAGVALTPAQIKTDVGDIIIRINGVQIVEASATFLLDLQKYYGDNIGAGNVNGIIPLSWARPHLATDQERSVFALGMADVSSFTIDVKVTGVAVLSSIEVLSEVTPEVRRLGQHIRINKFPQSFATTGLQEITTLPKEGNDVGYLALYIEESAGAVDKVTVKLGGNNIFEEVDPYLNQVLLEKTLRNPQAGYFHVAFDRSNDLSGLIPMVGVQDFRQQITWNTAAGAPGNYNIYTERIFGLNVKK
jgi:hypothetical protein